MPRASFAEWDEDDALDREDERPSRRARKPLPWLRVILLSCLSIAGLVYFAQQGRREKQSSEPKSIPASVLIAPAPVWKPVSPSPAVYALERSVGPLALQARQHTSGAREDTMIVGAFGAVPHAQVTLFQGFAEPERSFFVDLVRRAAEAGLSVARNAQSRMIATKFGPVEAAAVTLAGSGEQSCQAFRFADRQAGFGFQGWLCGGEANASGDTQLVCFIDGIALAGGTNPSLKAVFAKAERSRTGACAPGAHMALFGPGSPPLRP